VLTEFLRNPARTNNPWIDRTPETELRAELSGHPAGVAVDLLSVTTDAGDRLDVTGTGWWTAQRVFWLKAIPTNAHTVDLTWVVQKTRSVEFTIAPPRER